MLLYLFVSSRNTINTNLGHSYITDVILYNYSDLEWYQQKKGSQRTVYHHPSPRRGSLAIF
ncbi:hypothetical protein BDW59DRAFT_149117 [Aspergillus cavernicola]|uniref:Uncharacterized protein n=1 Tax=Aspergillus cavernicola TaxID=176166 RepID=A0ABR4I4V2_9EURO